MSSTGCLVVFSGGLNDGSRAPFVWLRATTLPTAALLSVVNRPPAYRRVWSGEMSMASTIPPTNWGANAGSTVRLAVASFAIILRLLTPPNFWNWPPTYSVPPSR